MVTVIAEFFQIIGLDVIPPSNMAELIPYLLQVIVGVWLVSITFGIIKELFFCLLDWRRMV